MNENKKILLIAYHFPPSLAVGGFRMNALAKHLPQNGWEPYILTIRKNLSEKNDPYSLKKIETFEIYRTGTSPTFIDGYIFLKRLLKSLLKKASHSATTSQSQIYTEKQTLPNESLFEKWKRYFNSVFITLPDKERNWIIPAVFKAVHLIKQEKIQYILTSSPPHSVQIIGFILKRILPVKWIVDFRDPWMTPFARNLKPNSQLSYLIERWLEKKIIKNADLILTTTPMLKNEFIKKFHTISKEKFACYPNGFDEELFSELLGIEKNDIFTIAYTGSTYLGRSPEPVFKAVKDLIKEKKIHADQIQIQFVGNCQYIDGQLTTVVASDYELDTIVKITGYIPRIEALKIVKKSHIALLIAMNQPYQIPAKIFEYLGAGVRIMALTQHGSTSDLINATESGKAFDPSDISGIKDFIYKEFLSKTKNEHYKHKKYEKYNRKSIVQDMAYHFEQL